MTSSRQYAQYFAVVAFICLTGSLVAGQKQRVTEDVAWTGVNSQQVLWRRDHPNSDSLIVDSLSVRIISGHNVIDATVGMGFIDQGDYFAVYVYISNEGQERFDVDPENFRIAYWTDKDAYLKGTDGSWLYYVAPEAIAKKYKTRAEWKAFFARLAGGAARATVTTEESGSVTVMNGSNVSTGTYSGTSVTSVPDRRAQVAANARAQQIINHAEESASTILRTSLQGNTVFPGQHVSGWAYFQRKRHGVEMIMLRVARSAAASEPRAVDYCFLTAPTK